MAAQRDLEVRWLGDANDLIRAADKAKRALDQTDTAAKKSDKSLALLKKGAVALGGAFAAARVGSFVHDSIQLGIAAEEAGNKFDAVFGPAAGGLADKLEALGDKAGIADFELENMIATTGNVILGLGGSTDEAERFAEKLAPLAVDVASFNGEVGAAPDVLHAMTSALTGEREALKTYGIVIKEADVQQRALADSGKTAASELSNLDKATATLALIAEGAGAAVGDLDRNIDSAATKQARATAEFKEASAELGQNLLPLWVELVDKSAILVDLLGLLTAPLGLIGQGARDAAADTDALLSAMDELGRVNPDDLAQAFNIPEKDIERLAAAGSSLEELHGALQKGPDFFEAWVMELVKSADQTKIHRGDLEQLKSSLEALGFAFEDAREEYKQSDQGFQDYMDTVHQSGAVVDRATIRQQGLTEATDDTTRAVREYKSELKKLSPIENYISKVRAAEEAEAALEEVLKDSTATQEERTDAALEAATANAELEESERTLRTQALESRDALLSQLSALGLTDDEIRDIIASIEALDGAEAAATINVGLTGSGAGLVSGNEIQASLPGGTVGFLQHGGITRRGGLAVVGEQGPELVNLPAGADVAPTGHVPLSALGDSGSGGGAVINVYIGDEKLDTIVLDAMRRNQRRGRLA